VEAYGLAYFVGTGSERRVVSFGGTVQDITERKERDEKEHLLMREVNHRAKNMLSVVDSIAHQTATRNPENFSERFSERIRALSANQDLLVRNEWNGVEIADLVRAQLAHFADLISPVSACTAPSCASMPGNMGAVDGCGPRRCPLEDRRGHHRRELDRAQGASRVCGQTTRLRHDSHAGDDGALDSIFRLRLPSAGPAPSASSPPTLFAANDQTRSAINLNLTPHERL
jgi:HWE histidine kinase